MSETEADATPEGRPEAGTPSTEAPGGSAPDRRGFLIGAGVAGAAAVAAGTAVLTRRSGGPEPGTTVHARRVRRVSDDPDWAGWDAVPDTRVQLDGQTTALPTRARPFRPHVEVQACYDAEEVAFRIAWDDPHRDDLTAAAHRFRDACAVLLAPDVMDTALRLMGRPEVQVTLLHWKADWQRDVDEGRQGPTDAFGNLTADYYPPLAAGSGDGATLSDYAAARVTPWVPGLHVGNPLSEARRARAVEKLHAHGFGTSEHAPTQDARGRGRWRDGRWRVVLIGRRRPSDPGEFPLRAGRDYGMAVAVWSGRDGDRGGRKSPSKDFLQLILEP
jgi:hypothetical protein